MSKDLVPFTNEKSLTPGKGGGLKFWRLQREKQQLRDEITDMASVMRRLSQELIEQLLFLKAPDRNIPEVIQRRMSQIVGALKRESKVLTTLFAIGDLHPALQRIFLEKRTPDDAELPAIDLEILEAPAALAPGKTDVASCAVKPRSRSLVICLWPATNPAKSPLNSVLRASRFTQHSRTSAKKPAI